MNRIVRQLPNLLTGLRLMSAPLMAFLILHGIDKTALGVFAFAGLSDAADGYLAKRFGLDSRFGAWLDPAADKLLMLACFVALAIRFRADPTFLWLAAFVIGRDLAIVAGVGVMRLMSIPLRIAPLFIGKVCTAVQVGFIGLMLVLLAFGFVVPRLVMLAEATVVAFTLAAWLAYGQMFIRALAPGRGTA